MSNPWELTTVSRHFHCLHDLQWGQSAISSSSVGLKNKDSSSMSTLLRSALANKNIVIDLVGCVAASIMATPEFLPQVPQLPKMLLLGTQVIIFQQGMIPAYNL